MDGIYYHIDITKRQNKLGSLLCNILGPVKSSKILKVKKFPLPPTTPQPPTVVFPSIEFWELVAGYSHWCHSKTNSLPLNVAKVFLGLMYQTQKMFSFYSGFVAKYIYTKTSKK